MSAISNTLLALSMSADAFAASISKGVCLNKPRLAQAMRIGAIFGIIETITPLLGWGLGTLASGIIADIDHWIAFGILCAIGCHMLYEACQPGKKETCDTHKLSLLILTAIGTSIDALAVGVTLAIIGANIWLISFMIGGATFLMATIGIMAGHYIGIKAGKMAEVAGGLCMIAIGSAILIEHLGLL